MAPPRRRSILAASNGEAEMVSSRMKRAYDAIATQYAERYSTMPAELAELGTELLDRLPETPTILDAGCGSGRDMAWFERVTGIDLSTGMLDQARQHVAGPLLEMDMTSLSLPDDAFNAVWCMAALLHVPRSAAPDVVARFRRVLSREAFCSSACRKEPMRVGNRASMAGLSGTSPGIGTMKSTTFSPAPGSPASGRNDTRRAVVPGFISWHTRHSCTEFPGFW